MNKKTLIGTGIFIGLTALLLTYYGNPANMGICVACFLRDTSGALGLHSAGVVQYIRPEIIGVVLGAFITSIYSRKFYAAGGSAPLTRLLLGILIMIGALVFLGCPLRMILRLAAGDLNALVGLLGYVAGIMSGMFFVNKGFILGKVRRVDKIEGSIFPVFTIILLALLIVAPPFIFFSETGPGALRAPIILSLGLTLIAGGLAYKSRLCMVGGFRDSILYRDYTLLLGTVGIFITVLIGNVVIGNFNLGFVDQPIAHTMHVWNFLGLFVVGWGAVLAGGCPFKQLVQAGSGNTDATMIVFGLIIGAAIAHNFGLAATPAGVSINGMIGIIVSIVLLLIISISNLKPLK